MSNETDMKYSFHVKKIEDIITSLQQCEDIDDAVDMYKEAKKHLNICQKKIELAKGEFERHG